MSKNIWATKRRKRTRKGKSSNSEPDAEIIERSRMADPNEPSISIGLLSDLTFPVKIEEEVIYPDTRFQNSTTLFPAKVVEENHQPPEASNVTFKRSAESEMISTVPKRGKMSDPLKTITSKTSDDCTIIEHPKTRVQVEYIDLTDDSQPVVPILCSPVKISYRENRLPDKHNTILPAVGDTNVRFEHSDKTAETNAHAVSSADVNYSTMQANCGQNKTSEVNTGGSYVDLPVGNASRIQIKNEKSLLKERFNEDESFIKRESIGVQINAEKGLSSECNTEVYLENSHVVVSKDTDSPTRLISEPNKENDNRGISVTIKVEQNENSDYSTPLSIISSDLNTTDIYSLDRNIKSEKNKTNENYEDIYLQKITNSYYKNTDVVSQTSITNDFTVMSVSPITDGGIFSGNTLLYEPGTFRTPLLKYLNCNTKVAVFEISHALYALLNLITKTENVIESEISYDFTDSQDKSEICLAEKGKELQNLQVNEKQSLKDEISQKILPSNFTEFVDLEPNITNLGLNETSCQLVNPITEGQAHLCDETRQSDSPYIIFESHPKMSKSCVKRWDGVAEKRAELTDLEEIENESLKVDKISQKNSLPNFTELVKLEPNITNLNSLSPSSQLGNSINENKIQSSLNEDGLVDERWQSTSPNISLESHSRISESSSVNGSDSHTIYFNTPMDIENFLEDKCPSIIFRSSNDKHERSALSINSPMEEEKNHNEYFSNDLLRQILGNATPTENSNIEYISSSLKPSVDSTAESNLIIDESLLQNLRQIRLPENKPVENENFPTGVKENNNVNNSGNFSKVPPKIIVKRSHGILNPSTTCDGAVQTQSKRIKMSENESISKCGSVNKLRFEEYKKDTHKKAGLHYPSDPLCIHLSPDFLLNSPNSSLGASNFGQNILTTPTNCENGNISVCSETSVQNPGYRRLVNLSSSQNPRLAPNFSPALQRDVNSQKPLGLFNIGQTCPTQSTPEVTKLPVYPLVNQITSGSKTFTMPNFSKVILSPAELYGPTINAMQIHTADQMLPQMNSFQPPYLNQLTSINNSHIFPSALETIPFSMAQHNPQQSFQGVIDQQPFLSLLNMPGDASSPSQYHHHLPPHEFPPPISMHNTINLDNYYSESVHFGFGHNPPLPVGNPPPPPPLPPTPPPIVEQPHSIASNISSRSLLHNNEKLTATKNITMPNQSLSKCFAPKPSLLPKQLREDIGKNIMNTNDFYHIIIERNIDWIHGIDKESGTPRMTENGGEFQQVRNSYRNHLMYYNTYFPLLLLECFSRISTVLKASKQKEKKDRNVFKVIQREIKENYVSLTCDSFIRHSEVDNIPKDGHVVLVKFAAIPKGNVRMLGYVYFSATRAYSHGHDHGNEILKYLNVKKRTDLMKIRINFYIVFGLSDINLDVPIHVSKLANIKKFLVLNDALKELRRSPLCDAILGLRKNNIKSFALPRRQDSNEMITLVQEIVQSLNPLSSQLTIVKSAPFTDSFLAIVQIVEEIRKAKIPGKILVCVRSEMLCQMGLNLLETSSNLVIINRERENVHERLHSRVLDVKISHVAKARSISEELAKNKVLQEAEVLLAVTGICFYEDVQSLARDLTFCIMHDAHSFTEPESLLPLLYGIRHLLLFGDPDESCAVNSKCGASLGYNKSLFHRAYYLC